MTEENVEFYLVLFFLALLGFHLEDGPAPWFFRLCPTFVASLLND